MNPLRWNFKSVWITGPGVNVRSTYPGGQYATMSGTSMACPHLAGVAALWVAGNPGVAKKDRPAAFRNWLKAVGSVAVRTDTAGHGIPDVGKINDGGGPVTPPPVTPGPGLSFTISFTDLSAVKQAELEAAARSGPGRRKRHGPAQELACRGRRSRRGPGPDGSCHSHAAARIRGSRDRRTMAKPARGRTMNTTSTAAELLTLGKIQAGAAVVLCGLVFSLCVISVVSILTRPKGKR